jgi:Mg-chelatase subunit ChlD
VITNTVLYALDRTRAGGNTNIADGIRLGIQVLNTVPPHYGRPGAAHIMVLMTDGEANEQPNSVCDDEDLWPDGGGAKDCVLYYARQARDNAIIIYTIGLGESADRELMAAVAELTGGFYRGADNREELDKIFDELFERIFLRLIH